MTQVLDPVRLYEQVHDRYVSYLETTFYFRDAELRRSFQASLREGHLSAGPFIETSQAFKRTVTPSELFPELLGTQPDEGFLKAVTGNRKLYWHQEQAIRLAAAGKNVVVATGTGSGKTEAFLYPILLELYRQWCSGQLQRPGVRALILYPMNALAFDQRDRLGSISSKLTQAGSGFGFTFGQYTGETPEDEKDGHRSARRHLADRLDNELVLRKEMRETPPHILLTNYSMLEYLLIRPDDCPLFDKSADTWRFLVVDEAHQYRGSRGNEMAMLLRRLKSRLRSTGDSLPFQCIATSATLAATEADRDVVTRFASDLFGEPFTAESLVLGQTVRVEPVAQAELDPSAYHVLAQALEDGNPAKTALAPIANSVGVSVGPHQTIAEIVASILMADGRAERVRMTTGSGPRLASELASELFPNLEPEAASLTLAVLAQLLVRSRDPIFDDALMTTRYHYFIRSLEGAFMSFHPQKSIRLSRPGTSESGCWFEIALCRQCGQHYLVGVEQDGFLREAKRDPSDPDAEATFYMPVEDGAPEENGDEEGSDRRPRRSRRLRLCTACGALWQDREDRKPPCGHDLNVLVEEQEERERGGDTIPRCASCGYPAADPVREVVHGTDGPHAVMATTLCEALPKERRRVLSFADSRQDAAFFAWYLEDSYRTLRTRNSIVRVLREMGEHGTKGVSLRTLAEELARHYKQRGSLPAHMDDLAVSRMAYTDVYAEFLGQQPRISLEGVGLVHWRCEWLDHTDPPEVLLCEPWSLDPQAAKSLVAILLDMVRNDGAFELRTKPGVTVSWTDLGLFGPHKVLRTGPPRKQTTVASWDGVNGRRVRFLAKCLERLGLVEHGECLQVAARTAGDIWNHLKTEDAKSAERDRLFISVNDACRLNPDWWRVSLLGSSHEGLRCDTCGQISQWNVAQACLRYRCPGTLVPYVPAELRKNHYRALYETLSGVSLRSEEHTAQIHHDRARTLQQEFRSGEIQLLSSSTTFELGVDLGELDVVFLRNVPPESFNYVQRVGRSGRRSGYPGIALTFCRRSPHDLFHFSSPERMLRGLTRLPGLTLRNPKIALRHMAAVLCAHFFRARPERFASVDSFCRTIETPRVIDDLLAHGQEHREELERTMRSILPGCLHPEVGLAGNNGPDWLDAVCGPQSRLADVVSAVSSDYRRLLQVKQEAVGEERWDRAKWATGRARDLATDDVISFLSRSAVIPKYGFPVDVVELDLQRESTDLSAKDVTLQRDLTLAVAEYAPTSKVVANKRIWYSSALKLVPERTLERYRYTICREHDCFVAWKHDEELEPPLPCGCPGIPSGTFIQPRFGFLADPRRSGAPGQHPARMFSTRPHFLGLVAPREEIQRFHDLVRYQPVSPGRMAVLCEGRKGQGFYICRECGAGFPSLIRELSKGHTTPHGRDCRGCLENVSLGHVFTTDVLRLDFPAPTMPYSVERRWFAHSLAQALVEGAAECLDVPSTDINATLQPSPGEALPGIVLYDNVPGGAGLVARLEEPEIFQAALAAAAERVSGACGCGPGTSCYGCLRTYRNQFAHTHLQRGPVLDYLRWLLDASNHVLAGSNWGLANEATGQPSE